LPLMIGELLFVVTVLVILNDWKIRI
jgi:hypothetical protein